jgi:hypothetical protein
VVTEFIFEEPSRLKKFSLPSSNFSCNCILDSVRLLGFFSNRFTAHRHVLQLE